MASGMEMMMRSMGFDPAVITKTISGMGETIVAFKEQLDRMEARQIAIMTHLNINKDETNAEI